MILKKMVKEAFTQLIYKQFTTIIKEEAKMIDYNENNEMFNK